MPKKKNLPLKAKREKKAKRNLRIRILVSLGMVFIFGMVLSFQVGDGHSPSYKPNVGSPSPTPKNSKSAEPTLSPTLQATPTKEQYNMVDSMAILGTFAIASQVPQTPGKVLDKFIVELNNAKVNPNKSNLDLGVTGNQLVDYNLTPQGFSDPVCFAVKAPTVEGENPKQLVWVIYFDPSTKEKLPVITITLGVTSCSQAKFAVSKMGNKTRPTISQISHSVLQEAILKVPSTFLTKMGLLLLDETRGLIATQSPIAPKP